MQAREEAGEIYPEKGNDDDGQSCDGPDAVSAGAGFAKHIAEVEVTNVNKPGGERPEFFGVPAPIVAPGELSPDTSEDKADCQ